MAFVVDDIFGKILQIIVGNPQILDKIMEGTNDMPNLNMPTLGGQVFWNNLAELDGWRIQQNTLTKHCRILDPHDIRRAWGSMEGMERAFGRLVGVRQEG